MSLQALGAGCRPSPAALGARPATPAHKLPAALGARALQKTQQGPSAAAAVQAAAAAAAAVPALVKAPGRSNILELNEHRRGVGLCIFRSDGLVFAARRVDDPQRSWQMPQGGIDPLENPMKAALRELHEETGITAVRIVGSIDEWLAYSFPTCVRSAAPGSFLRYRGQTQKWYLLEYQGDELEIDLTCYGHPEFSEYSWLPLDSLPAGVVDFKQGVYQEVARHFAPEIARRVGSPAVVRGA